MKTEWINTLYLGGLLLCSQALCSPAAPAAAGGGPTPYPERLRWWADARFGMFVHWGPVSLKGTEIGWSRGAQVPADIYDGLYKQFNPTNFDANAWAALAKATGMKYLVLTTKHHDGFCLWDTKQNEYNIMRTPFGRDVVKELAVACQRQGIVFCAYHSILDWWQADYPLGSPGGNSKKPNPNMDRYNAYLKAQLAELINNYGPLGVLWFDGQWEAPWTKDRGSDLYDFCRALQPSLIINNRVSQGPTAPTGKYPGEYDTPEQSIGNYMDHRPWETCMTICQQWAWKPNDNMKSLAECLRTLVRCAGGDGNLLFNVGPMPDGRIEPRQADRLKEMGAWLAKHGESVYGTRGGPWKPTQAFASTRRGDTVFLHVFRWTGEGITLPKLPRNVVSASLLGEEGEAKVTSTGDNLTVSVASGSRPEIDTVVRLKLDRSAMDIPALAPPSKFKMSASNVFQGMTGEFGPEMAVDGDAGTRWATDSGTKQAWIEMDLGQPRPVKGLTIDEWFSDQPRVQAFQLQYWDNGWKTFLEGTTLGSRKRLTFPPITAQRLRLNILNATEGPTLNEIELEP